MGQPLQLFVVGCGCDDEILREWWRERQCLFDFFSDFGIRENPAFTLQSALNTNDLVWLTVS